MTMFRDDFSAQAFLLCVAAGICTAILYDLFRCFRVLLFTLKGIDILLDLLFCIFAVVIAFLVALPVSFGRLRVYQVAGEIAGAVAYYFTAGDFFRRFFRLINRKKKINGTVAKEAQSKQMNLGKRSQNL